MISYSIVFFYLSLFSFYVLCQQSPIPSIYLSIYLSIIFFHSSPTRNFGLPHPQFPLHFLDICSFFHMTTNFVLELSFTPTSTLISSIFSYQLPRLFLPGCFSQTFTFCCFSVSAIVSSAFMYFGVTHELSTFPLRLHDTVDLPSLLRLSSKRLPRL